MAAPDPAPFLRWYRSLYFRIGFVFVAFVLGLLLLQGLVLNTRSGPPLRGSPTAVVALVAADLAAALSDDHGLDVDAYLKRQYVRAERIYVILKGGAVASNQAEPLGDDMRRYAMELMSGGSEHADAERTLRIPFVTAPIQMDGTLTGIVLLPMPQPSNQIVRDVRRLASVPSTTLLVVLTIIAAAVVFEPTRRRMAALRYATQRLGAGDLTARAAVTGFDEVAELASSFNKMADELSVREDALRRSDQLRRQMLADVSHELKTPLTAMRGYVETLHREDVSLDRETRERYFHTLERETLRLDRIVKDLLDLARMENGVAELDTRVFAVRRLLEHVIRRHEQEVQERHIRVNLHVDDDADQMVADPNRIEQLIENLFANALRHVPDAGTVELSASLEADAYALTVSDSGSGILPEHLPLVFERFYRADSARSHGGGGSGLGLSISKAIAERHGGRIDVESRPGRTRFTIRFPLDVSGERPGNAQSASTNL